MPNGRMAAGQHRIKVILKNLCGALRATAR
jgi:hypothetical protein